MKNLFHLESEKGSARFVWQNSSASAAPQPKTPEELKQDADDAILALETTYPNEIIEQDDVSAARAAYESALALVNESNGLNSDEANKIALTGLNEFAVKLEAAEAQIDLTESGETEEVLTASEEAKKMIKESVVTMLLAKLGIEKKEDNAEQVKFSKDVIDFLNTNQSDFDNYMSPGAGVNAFAEQFSETIGKMNLDSQNPQYEDILTKFKEIFEVFIAQQKGVEKERKIKEANEGIASFDLERVLSRLGGMGVVMDSIKEKLAGRVKLLEFDTDDKEYNAAARVSMKAELTKKVRAELDEWIKINTPALEKHKERNDTFYEEAPEFKSQVGNVAEQGIDAVTGIFKAEYSGFQRFESDSILKQVFAQQEAAIAVSFVNNGTNVLSDPNLELDKHIEAWLDTLMSENKDFPFKDLSTKFHALGMDPDVEGGKEDIQTLIDKMKTVPREYVGGEWEVKYESYVKKTGPEALGFDEWIDMQEISAWDRIFLLFKKFFTGADGTFDLMAFMNKEKEGNIEERPSIANLIVLLNGEEVEDGEDVTKIPELIRRREELIKKIDEKPEDFIFAGDDENATAKAYIKNMSNLDDLYLLESILSQAGEDPEYYLFSVALKKGLSIETLLKMKGKESLVSVENVGGEWKLFLTSKIKGQKKAEVEWNNEEIQELIDKLVDLDGLEILQNKDLMFYETLRDASEERGRYEKGGTFNDRLNNIMGKAMDEWDLEDLKF